MYPYQRTPKEDPYKGPIGWVFMAYNPQKSPENTG